MEPGARDFGGFKVETIHGRRQFDIKMYPRIVRVMKSFNPNAGKAIASSLSGNTAQIQAAHCG